MAAPRPMWKGHLKLSLVSFAVRLYSATDSSERVSFNMLHKDCGRRLKQQMVCPVHGDVPRSDIVKGYEFEEDRYVVVEAEELKRLEAAKSKTIEIDQFVDRDELETIYFERPYYLGPDGKIAEEGFGVIHEAMRRTRKVGIGRHVFHGTEHIVALELQDKGFRLTTMRSAEDIRDASPIFEDITKRKPSAAELRLAEDLINSISGPLDVRKFRDRYQEALHELVQAKIEGQEPIIAEEEEPVETYNFLDALKKSVGQLEGKSAAKPNGSKARSKRKKPPARSVPAASGKRKRKRA